MSSATFLSYNREGQHNTASPRDRSGNAIGLKPSSAMKYSGNVHPAAVKRYSRVKTVRIQHFDLGLHLLFFLAFFHRTEENTFGQKIYVVKKASC